MRHVLQAISESFRATLTPQILFTLNIGLVLLLGASIPAHSLIGPPEPSTAGEISVGGEISTGSKEVDISGRVANSSFSAQGLDLDKSELLLRGRYGITDQFSAFALLGASSFDLGTLTFPAVLGNFNGGGDLGFHWGVGVDFFMPPRALFPDLEVGVSGEYRRYNSGLNTGDYEADEFMLALKASRRFDRLRPYGGFVLSFLDGNFDGRSSTGQTVSGEIESSNTFGLFVGADYDFSDRLTARLEGEFLTSTRINLGVIYKLKSGGVVAAPRAPRPEPPVERTQPVATAPSRPAAETAHERQERERLDRRDIMAAQDQIDEGNRLFRLSRYAAAMPYFLRATQLDPGNFRAHYNLGTTLYQMRDFSGAADAYRQAVSIRPNDADAYLFLGFSHYRLGDMSAAARSWERVLELDPGNSVALNNLQALGR